MEGTARVGGKEKEGEKRKGGLKEIIALSIME